MECGSAVLREELELRFSSRDDLVESESMFGHGRAYWVNGKEIAHFEAGDCLEIRLTKAVIRDRRDALKSDERVELRRSGADWITVRFAVMADVDFVEELISLASAAHRPPAGTAAKPPPTGADLERRRRFH